MFTKRGYIVVSKSKAKEDDLMAAVIDAGGDDLRDDDDNWEVLSAPEVFPQVLEAVKKLGIEPDAAEISMLPQNYLKLEGKQARLRLIWTQAAHWAAVLIAMNIMLISRVQQLMPTPATGLVLLVLLALGTFLAGLSLRSLTICFLGLAMAVAIPALSWLQQSVIFFVLGAILLIGLGLVFWLRSG